MRYLLIACLIAFVSYRMTLNTTDQSDLVGLWKFPDIAAWVQIDAEGNVFQCRIDTDRSAISAQGKLNGGSIIWVEHWGKDKVIRDKNTLYLDGIYGEFSFEKVYGVMAEICQNPLP